MASEECYEVLDTRFARLFNSTARVHRLHEGCRLDVVADDFVRPNSPSLYSVHLFVNGARTF